MPRNWAWFSDVQCPDLKAMAATFPGHATTPRGGGYILGFRADPVEHLEAVHTQIHNLWSHGGGWELGVFHGKIMQLIVDGLLDHARFFHSTRNIWSEPIEREILVQKTS